MLIGSCEQGLRKVFCILCNGCFKTLLSLNPIFFFFTHQLDSNDARENAEGKLCLRDDRYFHWSTRKNFPLATFDWLRKKNISWLEKKGSLFSSLNPLQANNPPSPFKDFYSSGRMCHNGS